MLVYLQDEKDSLCRLKSKVPLSLWQIDSYLRHFELQGSQLSGKRHRNIHCFA